MRVKKYVPCLSLLVAALWMLSGCASMPGLTSTTGDKFSRTIDYSFEKVVKYLEISLDEKKMTYKRAKDEKDEILYESEMGASLDTRATLWLKPGSTVKINVVRLQNDKTQLVITAESNFSLLPTDTFKVARDIYDGMNAKFIEEAEHTGRTVTAAPSTVSVDEKTKVSVVPLSEIDKDIPVAKLKKKNTDSIAVVIGNRDYVEKDIPSVEFAINDAESVKKYLVNVFGYREGNIIYEPNASKAKFESIFGTKDNHKGKLYNYLKNEKSDIFIYYSGHGAPDPNSKKGYFVPVDADPQGINMTGYPLQQLYDNVAKTANDKKTSNVFIVVDACFSGSTEKGMLLKNMSPISITIENPLLKIPNAVVITSSDANEISSWYPEKGHSMFTYFFLKSIRDEVKKGEKNVTAGRLFSLITDESEGLPYYTRRLHQRIQTPQLMGDGDKIILGE